MSKTEEICRLLAGGKITRSEAIERLKAENPGLSGYAIMHLANTASETVQAINDALETLSVFKKLKCGCIGIVYLHKFFVISPCDADVEVGLVNYYKDEMESATNDDIMEASAYIKAANGVYDESRRANTAWAHEDVEDDEDEDIEDWWEDEEPVFIPEDIVKKCHTCGQWLRFHTIPEGAFKTTATCTYCGVEGEYHIEAVA